MPEDRYYLTKGDVLLLRQMLAEYRQRHTPRPGGPDPYYANDHQAPETYYALTPTGGVPAMSGSVPGTADCDIYHLTQNSNTLEKEVSAIPNLTKPIYNFGRTDLPEDTYVAVTRDKFGHWLPIPPYTTPGGVPWDRASVNQNIADDTITLIDAGSGLSTTYNLESVGTGSGVTAIRASALMLWYTVEVSATGIFTGTYPLWGSLSVSGGGEAVSSPGCTLTGTLGLQSLGFTVGPIIAHFDGGEEIDLNVYHKFGGLVNFHVELFAVAVDNQA